MGNLSCQPTSPRRCKQYRYLWTLVATALWPILYLFRPSLTEPPHLIESWQPSVNLLTQVSHSTVAISLSSLDLTRPKLANVSVSSNSRHTLREAHKSAEYSRNPCAGKYVYIHRLPSMFNEDFFANCHHLSPSANTCKVLSNGGFGLKLEDVEQGVVNSSNSWYATDQFALEVIFHNRIRQYKCLTRDSAKATLIYVPFYAGLDISRNLWGANVSARDSLPQALADWLERQTEWSTMRGGDHFLVCGRMTWDFRRSTDRETDWGNSLFKLPSVRNMSALLIEKSPWDSNDFGIPYPTYFHPSKDSEVLEWQNRMRSRERPTLFSFAGAPRPELQHSIRGEVIEQCKNSTVCKLLECDRGTSKCNSPSSVMNLFQESVFCLQPPGDSFTRRSLFDSMVAGCIPVLFHPDSAYTQYIWHLPHNHSAYSVYIPEDDVKRRIVKIENILGKIPAAEVHEMREQVVNLIPRLIYADPRHRLTNVKDAFDVAIQALIHRVTESRKRTIKQRDDGQLESARSI